MKKQHLALIIVLSLVIIVTLSFILYNEWPYMTGDKIILATFPIDPFDPFMGQYITINYEISSIDESVNFNEGDKIYVSLKEDEQGIWRKQSISASKPDKGDFIKGEVTSKYGTSINVDYGIEQFFFERDADIPTRNLTVEVAIANSGRAKIVQLLYNGKPLEIDYSEVDLTS